MSRFLLDVNALLALLDPMHIHHDAVHEWYGQLSDPVLLTCAHVENGVIRVASQPQYPNSLGTSSKVREVLQRFVSRSGHERCRETASLLDDALLLKSKLLTPNRVADFYLLAMAVANEARLATFDRKIPAEAVAGGPAALALIPELS
jgi:toxin-antitoxin system PIN domain toxin